MKTALVALLTMLSFSAFANINEDVQPEARTRYNCFYQDTSMGYRHGAIGSTLASAKGQARRYCQDFVQRNETYGQCHFVGCRTLNYFVGEE